MPAAEPITLTWLLEKAWILLIGIMWYGKKNSDRDNLKRDEAIAELEKEATRYVTELQMRDTIRESLEPYKEDQQEIKLLLRGLNQQIVALSKDLAVQTALANIHKDDT